MRRIRTGIAMALGIGLLAGALTSSAGARSLSAAGCSWPLTLRHINLAYPDDSADYWMTHFGAVPASSLVIRGRFPSARYFSFHAYDEAQRPVASISDHEIVPDGGSNPFDPSLGGRKGGTGTYTVRVLFEPKPEDPEPNTVYAGEMENGARNPAGFVIYRIYIPDDPKEKTGGVPLPEITLRTAGGAVEHELGQCEPLPPPAGEQIDEAARDSNYTYVGSNRTHVPGTYPVPKWKRFYGADREFRDWCPDPNCQEAGPKTTSGFLANQQISYLYARISHEYGELVVIKAKAPTFPDTRAGEDVNSPRQVRYWSFCQNNDATQRVVRCSPDHETVVDKRGYATFVISDPEDRPANATRANGVNYLEWGGFYYSGIVIYRHMLPARSFKEAIQNIPEGTPPEEVMKSYMPVAAYCETKTFEKTGAEGCLAASTRE
ncbi:MAG: hypothetical protein ACLGIB_00735 [Actinomycetota bacterium]